MAVSSVDLGPRILNRELSQLDFNGRVLEIAGDESMPLLDRVNFCAIFSHNMDEFFMVRVAGLMDQVAAGLTVRSPGGERFARVKVPELLPRFLPIGSRGLYVPLERVIRHYLGWLFPAMEVIECTVFRVTRDADFAVSDEADDLLEAVELELRRRRFGEAVRVEVSGSCSTRMLKQLKSGLVVDDDQIYLVPGLLDLAELHEFFTLDRPDLKDESWLPVVPGRFGTTGEEFF